MFYFPASDLIFCPSVVSSSSPLPLNFAAVRTVGEQKLFRSLRYSRNQFQLPNWAALLLIFQMMDTWIWNSLKSWLYPVSLTMTVCVSGASDGWGDRGWWQWWGRRWRLWGPGSRCSPWAQLPHHRVVLHQHLLHLAHPRGTTPPGQLDGPHPFWPTS